MRSSTSNVGPISRNFHDALKACLDALYPNRHEWGNKPQTNATGVKDVHLFLIGKDDYLTLNQIKDIYVIVKKRLNKKSCCWPCYFGKRDPFVESLYTALDKLDVADDQQLASTQNTLLAAAALNELTRRIQQHNMAVNAKAVLPTEQTALVR